MCGKIFEITSVLSVDTLTESHWPNSTATNLLSHCSDKEIVLNECLLAHKCLEMNIFLVSQYYSTHPIFFFFLLFLFLFFNLFFYLVLSKLILCDLALISADMITTIVSDLSRIQPLKVNCFIFTSENSSDSLSPSSCLLFVTLPSPFPGTVSWNSSPPLEEGMICVHKLQVVGTSVKELTQPLCLLQCIFLARMHTVLRLL